MSNNFKYEKYLLDVTFNTLFEKLKYGECYVETMNIKVDSFGYNFTITTPVTCRKKNNLLFKHYTIEHFDCNEIIADNESIYKALYHKKTNHNSELANKLNELWKKLQSRDSLNEENELKNNLEKIINAANKGE